MANALYDKGREAFAKGDINWKATGGDTIKVILIDLADYTVDLAAHDFLNHVPGDARVATATLTLLDPTNGVCDANNVTFTLVTGDISEALIIYKDTGTESSSPLIAYIDTATGLPVTPNGGDIGVTWDNGANKIFKL